MLVTYKGNKISYYNLTKEDIDLDDILQSISRISRFLGHSSRAYSVGEHTLIGLIIAEEMNYSARHKMYWLVHDFTEAYVGDCPTPLKKIIPDFRNIEAQVEGAVMDHFGLEPMTANDYDAIKRIDRTMLVMEMRDLTLHTYQDFINDMVFENIIEDDYFTIGKNEQSADLIHKELLSAFHKIKKEYEKENSEVKDMELKLKTFEIYVSFKDENFSYTDVLEFKDEKSALDYARESAYEYYYLSPRRDVMDIIKEDNVSDDIAFLTFEDEMKEVVNYSVKEVE